MLRVRPDTSDSTRPFAASVGWIEPSGLAFGKPKDRLRETHHFSARFALFPAIAGPSETGVLSGRTPRLSSGPQMAWLSVPVDIRSWAAALVKLPRSATATKALSSANRVPRIVWSNQTGLLNPRGLTVAATEAMFELGKAERARRQRRFGG